MTTTLLAADPAALKHLTGWRHPESPSRYAILSKTLELAGFKTPQTTLHPRPATREELLLCHTEEYIRIVEDDIKKVTAMGLVDGNYMLSTGDAPICPASLDVALLAVGGVLVGIDAVMQGQARNVFSLMRPP